MGAKETDQVTELVSDDASKAATKAIDRVLKSKKFQTLLSNAVKPGAEDGGLKSRKLWMTALGCLAVMAGTMWAGVNPDIAASTVVGLLGSYNVSNALAKPKGPKP